MNTAIHGGDPGAFVLLVPLIWAAFLATLFVFARRARQGMGALGSRGSWQAGIGRDAYDENSPIAIIGRRFANGEIDEEEYWRRLSVLEEQFGRGEVGRRPGL
jgi:putative membrane protein